MSYHRRVNKEGQSAAIAGGGEAAALDRDVHAQQRRLRVCWPPSELTPARAHAREHRRARGDAGAAGPRDELARGVLKAAAPERQLAAGRRGGGAAAAAIATAEDVAVDEELDAAQRVGESAAKAPVSRALEAV